MTCFRCGRKGHFASNCFARTGVDGQDLNSDSTSNDEESDSSNDEDSDSSSDENADDTCFRCGRKGHYANNCYARTAVNGQDLNSDSSSDVEVVDHSDSSSDVVVVDHSDSSSDENADDTCFRCGRKGHYASNCYARTAVNGQDLNSDSSSDVEVVDHPSPRKKMRLNAPTHQDTAGTSSFAVPRNAGIYVLRTAAGLYYVGKSTNINARIQDHRSGKGAACLVGSSFQVVTNLLTSGSVSDLEPWERDETLHRMMAHGIENVRGWMFTSKILSETDRQDAFKQICERFDLCRRCGRNTHFVDQCVARTLDGWAGGGECLESAPINRG